MSDLCSKPGCTRQIPDFSQRCPEHEIQPPRMLWFFFWALAIAFCSAVVVLVLFGGLYTAATGMIAR